MAPPEQSWISRFFRKNPVVPIQENLTREKGRVSVNIVEQEGDNLKKKRRKIKKTKDEVAEELEDLELGI